MIPTASRLELAATCRLSSCLPVVQTTSAFSSEGSVFHAFFQQIVELRQEKPGQGALTLEIARLAALEAAPVELRPALELVRLDTLALDPNAIAAEVAFAFDVSRGTARELGRGLNRDYGELGAMEFAGTIDRAAMKADGGGYVGDYKRWGWTTPRCKDNRQIKFAALCLARVWGAKYVDAEIVRIDDDGETWGDVARFEPFDLDQFEAELFDLMGRIVADREAYAAGDLPEATTSDGCRYCPSLPYCPAKMMIARAVIGQTSDEVAKLGRGELLITMENAPRLWDLAKQAKAILETLTDGLKDLARVTPFTLADGSVVGPVPWPGREVTDGRKARAYLVEKYGEKAADVGTKVTVSLDGINLAVKEWIREHPDQNVRGMIGKQEEAAFAELMKRGLARKIETVQIRAKKPPKSKT